MLIVWGKKKTLRRMGYVAEFCPVCREITPCRLVRIGLTGHLWYISFSQGRELGNVAECCTCGYEQEVNATFYAGRSRSSKIPLPQLIQQTFPAIDRVRAAELEEAAVVRGGGMRTAEERQRELLRGMALFIGKIDHVPSPLTITKPAGWCMVLTILLMVAINRAEEKFDIFEKFPQVDSSEVYKWVFLSGMGIALVLMIGARILFLRRKVLPAMARCLRPLHPSQAELEQALERFRAARVKVGSSISARSLLAEIEKTPA